MIKKRKYRLPRGKPAPGGLAPQEPSAVARADLAAGRFREAIGRFKERLKTEDRAEWREGLAAAYAGRAEQLAAKGMLKEALAIWKNRQQLGAAAAFAPAHAAILLRLGLVSEALALYRGIDATADPEALAALRVHLAASYLAAGPVVAEGLPADDPVLVHGLAARAALDAYCSGDEAALGEALAAIPFRSPYRDWAQVLKGLHKLAAHPGEAAALLARVPADSPFAPLRAAAELALVPERALEARLGGAAEAAQRFALTLRGWTPERQALRQELRRLGTPPSPLVLLRFMQRHRGRLGEAWVRWQGLRLLVKDYPRSLRWFAESGGPDLSEAERGLVAAWFAEGAADPNQTLEAWTRYAELLKRSGNVVPGTDQALRIALVQRHFERRGDMLVRVAAAAGSGAQVQRLCSLLEESLRYDPDDSDTYLRLIRYYREVKQLRDARRLLEQALKRFPGDVKLLTAALDTALAAGSFKKAAGLAREVLALDPINGDVRERLVGSHLAHARKQIRNRRTDLARKELDQATEWARGERSRERVDLTAGFLALAENAKTGFVALRVLDERLGSGLAGRLALALEAVAVGRDPVGLLKQTGLPAPVARDGADLLAFLARLRAHLDAGEPLPPAVGTYLEKPLKAGSRYDLSLQEAELACETLRRAALHGARLEFARAALGRWREEPVFELHAFEARHKGRTWSASDEEFARLERALDRAQDAGDMRTSHRLEELLDRLDVDSFSPSPSQAPPPDMVRDVFGHLIEALGIDALCDRLGLSAAKKGHLKQIERELGREALLEAIGSLIGDAFRDLQRGLGPAPRSRG